MLNKKYFVLEFQGLGKIHDLFKISKRFFQFLAAERILLRRQMVRAGRGYGGQEDRKEKISFTTTAKRNFSRRARRAVVFKFLTAKNASSFADRWSEQEEATEDKKSAKNFYPFIIYNLPFSLFTFHFCLCHLSTIH